MNKIVFNACCALVVIGLAQTAYANLNIDGVDNASWPNGDHLNGNAIYTSAATDPTSVSGGDIQIGRGDNGYGATGSLTVNSGTLNVNNTGSALIIGQTFGTGTVTVKGGTLNLTATASGDVMIGNSYATGTVNMKGGYLNIDTTRLAIGRDESGSGRVNIDGGTLTTTATSLFIGMGGDTTYTPSGILTFGSGNGVLDFVNGLTTIEFGTTGGANYINFLTGSDGKLEINGWTKSQFEDLVLKGDLRIDGNTATADDFTYIENDNVGAYQLVTAPEPSSLAMLCFGLLSAGTLIRRRK